VTVYVIKIGAKNLGSNTVIGAVYNSEQEAIQEVQRLNQANSFTRATYVARELGRLSPTRVGWGHE
jgi:hypothetical protein